MPRIIEISEQAAQFNEFGQERELPTIRHFLNQLLLGRDILQIIAITRIMKTMGYQQPATSHKIITILEDGHIVDFLQFIRVHSGPQHEFDGPLLIDIYDLFPGNSFIKKTIRRLFVRLHDVAGRILQGLRERQFCSKFVFFSLPQ